jgi:hypothetical protein
MSHDERPVSRPPGVLNKGFIVLHSSAATSLPWKPEPAIVTVAPVPPLLGTITISDNTEKLTVPKSPVEPVIVSTHPPPPRAPEATVNPAEREPVEVIVHVYVVKRFEPAGTGIVHVPASDGLNPDPEIVTVVPEVDAGAGIGA